jgi:catechol 2,3-dioxygenase-like lactoylglutathione lyase family enzyme
MDRTYRDAKLMAQTMRARLQDLDLEISHSQALEIVASQFGFANWNVLAAKLDSAPSSPETPVLRPAIPILRIFSEEKSREFYLDFLGFELDWEHRFSDDSPLYCQVSRGEMTLHLSEHAGDASPAARVYVWVTNLDAFHVELSAKEYRYMRPGIEHAPWAREMEVVDPFHNRITFAESVD